MNLTAAMEKACKELQKMGSFNGLPVVHIHYETEEQKRIDAASDGMTPEQTERYVNDYTTCGFHIDTYNESFDDDQPYVDVSFNHYKLQKDFREWLLQFVDGDESVLPKELDLQGGDNEIMKQGYTGK